MAETTENVYSIDFDADKFVAGVEAALKVIKKFEGNTEQLEAAMKALQANVNGVSFTKPLSAIQQLAKGFQALEKEGKIDWSGFNKGISEFLKTAPEMESFLADVKKAMEGLSQESEEFKELSKIIGTVEASLKQLKEESEDTDKGGFVPLKKRLKELKLSMQELEEQGKENTEEYKQQRLEAARLTDQLGDQAEAIRVLASDTYALDAAVDTLKAVTAGFQLFEGAMALAGTENEELQKSMQKLMALMNIANGLQELQNFLTGQSPGKLALQNTWTKALAASNSLLSKTTWGAALAARGFGTALAATGIGAIVVAVGYLVSAFIDWIDTSDDAREATDRLNKSLAIQDEKLGLSIDALKRQTNRRVAELRSRGATEEEIFKEQAEGERQAIRKREEKYATQREQYLKAKAVAQKRGNKEELDAVENLREKLVQEYNSIQNDLAAITDKEIDFQTDANKKKSDEAKKNYEELIKLQEDYQKRLRQLENEAENVKDELSPKSEKSIRAKYARELKVEQDENKKQFAKLGKARVDEINKSAATLSNLRADVEVNGFKKEQQEARDEFVKTIRGQQQTIVTERIALIEDEYERVNAEIKNQEEVRRQEIQDEYDNTTKAIANQLAKGLITQEDADKFSSDAAIILVDSLNTVGDATKKALLDNQKTLLEGLLQQADNFANLQDAQAERAAAEQILTESNRYREGKITYEQYQESLLKIQKDAGKKALAEDIKQGQARLEILEEQLAAEKDEKIRVAIQTQIELTKKGIAQAKSGLNDVEKELEGVDGILQRVFGLEDDPKAAEKIQKFRDATNKAIQSTIDLIKQSAAADVEAADKAIESQRRRVEEAGKIAEEGNAEYLKQEEDRLRELELKREAAARKQLRIDAALQASQILVAVASAAADSFKKGAGAIGVATGIASIIAAIASGAALVKSIQNSQPKFFEGTDYVTRGKNKVGRDTIPAMLNEGEAVISTDTNKRYRPTIMAIRRGLLPENVINNFVQDYTKGVRYDNISSAVTQAPKFDDSKFTEMNERLARLESVMTTTAQAIQGLGVNVRMDEDGFAASITTHLNKRNKILNS